MRKKRIKDIPMFNKPLRETENVLAIKSALPLLKLLGANTTELAPIFSEIEGIQKEMIKLANLPDKFNDIFSSIGWIMSESMSTTVAEAAIQLAESGNIEEAEAVIVDYYKAETVQLHLQRMKVVRAFLPRMRLAEKALIDYKEERYHAVIPLVILLLDGMVNDVNKTMGIQKGFHAEGVNLEAWDSIAGHSTGLTCLRNIFCKSRRETNTDTITVPYRHGIMHGVPAYPLHPLNAQAVWPSDVYALKRCGAWV